MTERIELPVFESRDIARCLEGLSVGASQSEKSLTLWPLLVSEVDSEPAPKRIAPTYVALADAIDAGSLRIGEVGEDGFVPKVVARNDGNEAVLVLFGEELRGAKQNRIANASFLVGARSEVVLDVSCVEQGRWSARSQHFEASGVVFSSLARRKVARRVAVSAAGGLGFAADQSEVWDEVDTKLRHARARSHTRAYADYQESRQQEIDEAAERLRAHPRQVGFVAAIGDAVAGLELVGRPEVFARLYRGLLGSYLVDAVDHAIVEANPDRIVSLLERRQAWRTRARRFETPESFVRAVARARTKSAPSLGLGEDVRLGGADVAGCALFAGEVVHMTAFPEPGR